MECVDIYPYLEGTEVKRITNLMLKKIQIHANEMRILGAINDVPWENLKIDEVVCVSNNYADFSNGKYANRHFSGIEDNLFSVFMDGKSSATTNQTNTFDYALPKELYLSLIN
jgi:hypothetical protein